MGAGWVRVLRAGSAQQGALLRERDIQALRGEIETLQARERELESLLVQLRDRTLAAEQQREDAQRTLYMAHRSVSELAGQLQSQQGRLDSARARIEKIDAELAQLAQNLEAAQDQAREARNRQEEAVMRMTELEDTRLSLESERRHARRGARPGTQRRPRIARHRPRAGADAGVAAHADRRARTGAGTHGRPARPARQPRWANCPRSSRRAAIRSWNWKSSDRSRWNSAC